MWSVHSLTWGYSDGCDFSNPPVRVQANRNGTPHGHGDFHFSIFVRYLMMLPDCVHTPRMRVLVILQGSSAWPGQPDLSRRLE